MSVVHHVPGRFRVRSAAVRRNAANAVAVERMLTAMPGVEAAAASTVTGSIVVRYDPAATEAATIMEALHERGYLSQPAHIVPRPGPMPVRGASALPSDIGSRIAGSVAQRIVELAVERSVAVLVAALL